MKLKNAKKSRDTAPLRGYFWGLRKWFHWILMIDEVSFIESLRAVTFGASEVGFPGSSGETKAGQYMTFIIGRAGRATLFNVATM